MRFEENYSIESDLDTSIILFLENRLDLFLKIQSKNISSYQKNGIEVVIICHKSFISPVLNFIKSFPLISWKLFAVDQKNLRVLYDIDFAVKNCSKNHIAVIHSHLLITENAISTLRYYYSYYETYYCISGTINKKTGLPLLEKGDRGQFSLNIFFSRSSLPFSPGISPFSNIIEMFISVCSRLGMNNFKPLEIFDKIFFILNETSKKKFEKLMLFATKLPGEKLRNLLLPYKKEFGISHNHKPAEIYNWSNNKFARELCREFLSKFLAYKIGDPNVFKKRYQNVALVQTYNESKHIRSLLKNLRNKCDGIILLDESDDNTFEIASGDILLLKVKKKRAGIFDDLGNRNILLDIASFINSAWFFFIDADERVSEQDISLKQISLSTSADLVGFYLVHLWDKQNQFRTDIAEPSIIKQPGITYRLRMFRNKGRMQLLMNRTLHIPVVPYISGLRYVAPILLKHYGNFTRDIRSYKYQLYMKEDPEVNREPEKYAYLLDKNIGLRKVSEIKLEGKYFSDHESLERFLKLLLKIPR